jgi:hypothetical protein
MSSSHETLLLNGAIVLSITSLILLALFALADHFLEAGLSSLTESVRVLEQEVETAQRLDEWKRRLHESLQRIDQLVTDLIDQQCDLREAAARWRAARSEGSIHVINRLYAQAPTEEERIMLHLIYCVGQRLEQQPKHCAEVLARLRLERKTQ